MPATELPYRQFQFPLNVFMHMLTLEEGAVTYLHYGLFDDRDEPITVAQERSTELLFSRLPPPPARVLDVGIGVGTTLARLAKSGYDATGITPDESQAALARDRYPDIDVTRVGFESLFPRTYDVVVFQESSQYIDATKLFAKAREITGHIVVVDEFAVDAETRLHPLDEFLRAANDYKFAIVEDLDLSARAAPTIEYFMRRFDRYRPILVSDLGLRSEQVDDLIASGARYRDAYARGAYVYRLLRFRRR
ncbi:MAG TPA: class I SAM-dependent methyltransferase [Thermoanaerobaculia bacterium]|nr:class I SAM-dependent methyltransferase [Thermoanaerobaculia bacterium]